jgi:hypothetical protein
MAAEAEAVSTVEGVEAADSMAEGVEVSTRPAAVITVEGEALPVARHPPHNAPVASLTPGPAGTRFVLMRTQAAGQNTQEIHPI